MLGKNRSCLGLLIVVVHFSMLGCHSETNIGSAKLVSNPQTETVPRTGIHESDWVTSSDGVIALRFSAAAAEFEKAKPIIVIAELRNDTAMPVNVLRPFGDDYRALSAGIELHGPDRRLPYTGDTLDYTLGGNAWKTLAPGESVRDRLDLTVDVFAGSNVPGVYEIIFEYYVIEADRPTAEPAGFKSLWIGKLKSRSIRVTKR